jgi:polyketide biosynthesis 3-hydroxy-3-methylglutaryl-CoA synthase-like enzyme PksG
MIRAGIEAMNVFGGSACLDLRRLAQHRDLDPARFENLLMKEKSVPLPHEDPVTFAANAARPLLDSLPVADRERIELLITCTESGIDFGKSISTYVHRHLGLQKNCRLFELKQACYSGTAGLQMAVNFVLSQTSPGAKALVVATDLFRLIALGQDAGVREQWSFAEPSSGAGAVAVLVGEEPEVFEADVGANGYYGYEVMDTCRPIPDIEVGDADLSLLSYLDCCEHAFLEYQKRVDGADYGKSFDYLAFHTPFGGMVKGAHRSVMRKLVRASPPQIEADFARRVSPALTYCQRVGNIMGGTVFLSLAGIIDHGSFPVPRRVGCFSYGSGCCSEFYSGVVSSEGQKRQRSFGIGRQLDERYRLEVEEYDLLLRAGAAVSFGTREVTVDDNIIRGARTSASGSPRLLLKAIRDFHREYEWTS